MEKEEKMQEQYKDRWERRDVLPLRKEQEKERARTEGNVIWVNYEGEKTSRG